ncbi:hypothetical protein B0T18DRAFT_429425 [Schizothecium vesticola]|uniref:Uncharacterized protein n=1 Tax=Schizothecium vesticola TaxID=314040 RepID=A0AA40EVR8_9PEZI|nr:hypothetical protein B0T18DRAFT_429425 [Schizothecium vesticola]
MADAPPEPAQARQKQRPEANKLQRRQRAYSFSPSRDDAITPGRRSSVRANQREMGTGALGGAVQRGPTLHNKRDGDHLPRKKSSKKRRKDDEQREAEIKAMSNFMPLRPATDDWTGARPLRRHSRRTGTGFGYGFTGSSRQEWDKYNRSSDISLAESVHSTFSSDSEHISFKVSVLEKLAPRPTLHYATYSKLTAEEDSGRLARTPSRQQRKLSAPIPEATLKAHKRIHDLADDLSASDLRELMDRDKRRRERRRQRDQEKLEAKLARRAEKQKEAAAQAEKEGRDSPPNLERGVFGRDVVGLGLDPTSAVVTSSRRRQKGKERMETDDPVTRYDARPDPLVEFHRTSSIPLQSPKIADAPAESKEAVPPVLASPRSKSSFLRLKLPRSMSPNDSDLKTEQSEPPESNHSKGPLSWATFFRWGNKAKRKSAAPSSFSNASRDSMQTPQQQQPTAPISFTPRKLSTGVPKRTRSRFREDLPELAAHKAQPHDRESIPPTIAESSPDPGAVTEQIAFAPPAHYGERNDTPTSEQRQQTPSIFGHPDEPSASPELHTLSLASIDSEASWLSGRLSKKRHLSSSLHASPYGPRPRGASESDAEAPQDQNTPTEDASITEDEYLARFAHSAPDRQGGNRKSTGDPRPSSDGEDLEETHWGTVKGYQPKVVHAHGAGRVKSREGLLKSFGEEGEVDALVSGPSESGPAGGQGVRRATSINLGKGHARKISAGSARLLSISPRSSVDTKRLSSPPKQEKINEA